MEEALPYVRMDQIIEFTRLLPSEVCSIKEITTQTKFGRSNVQNIIPSLQLLRIAEYEKKEGVIKLTDIGRRFRAAIITDDKKASAESIRESVDSSEVLSFAKGLLERKGSLTVLEIGRELSFRFGKKWKNILTFKTYGAACSTILAFVGYGVYDRGILRKEEVQVVRSEITPPYTTFNKMLKIVEVVSTYDEVDIHNLAKRLLTKEGRLSMEIKNCIDLGFLLRPAPGKVAVTEKGRELVDPLNKSKRSDTWANMLTNSEFFRIIASLKNTEFSVEDLGEILKHKLGGKWFERKTIISFGKKFCNWLKSAKLIEATQRGRYRVIASVAKVKRREEPVHVMSTVDYYELGKSVGILSSANGNHEKSMVAAEKLIQICEREKDLSTVTDLLKDHQKLFLELRDNRIFHADIKLIEKFLGVEAWNKESDYIDPKPKEPEGSE